MGPLKESLFNFTHWQSHYRHLCQHCLFACCCNLELIHAWYTWLVQPVISSDYADYVTILIYAGRVGGAADEV